MKVLITGMGGQLGRELCKHIPKSICYAHSSADSAKTMNINSSAEILREIKQNEPDVIINASAMTNVDQCETDRSVAMGVNGTSLKYLSYAARMHNAYLVHISTDYVFDGLYGNYDEYSPPNPINYYGLSKLVGDIYADSYENSLIVRSSGVFGHSKNFPRFAYETLKRGEILNVIDSYYSPIHAHYLAKTIIELLKTRPSGIMNVAGERTSRYNLASKIAEIYSLDSSLIHLLDGQTNFKARRPYDSSLNINRAKSQIPFDFYSLKKNLSLLRIL